MDSQADRSHPLTYPSPPRSFFIFFTFKGWKRLLLADAPRQVINGISLYSFGAAENFTTDLSTYFSGSWVRSVTIVTMTFSVLVWAGSFFLLIVAAALYVPLLCYIQVSARSFAFASSVPIADYATPLVRRAT